MGETPRHRDNLAYLVEMLRDWYEDDPQVYVSGNMFVYYVPGNRHRHVSPDVFVVKGVPKQTDPERRRYLTWEEGKNPDVIIELTSESTREEDIEDKMTIYRDILRVHEYFLFDPYGEYLEPQLQGYRLEGDLYQPIAPVNGRLPSETLRLHLEAADRYLRLYDPAAGSWLRNPPEEKQARREAEAEVMRLREELERLRRQLPPQQP